MMQLSVIVPVYNMCGYLDRCLQSLIGQDFPQMEIVLVDDGSTDGSGELCDKWAARHSNIRVVHQPNGGLSHARNTGLDLARGEVVTFVDADDAVDAGTYRRVVPLLEGEVDMVEFSVLCGWMGPRPQLFSFGRQVYASGTEYWTATQAFVHTYACNKIYRMRLFAGGVRFPVSKVFEDAHTLPLLLRQARRVATTDSGRYLYFDNNAGITACATGLQLQSLLAAHLSHWDPSSDARFYARLLNIQLDVCRLTDEAPLLPACWPAGLCKVSATQWLKIVLANTIGMSLLCKVHKHFCQMLRRH